MPKEPKRSMYDAMRRPRDPERPPAAQPATSLLARAHDLLRRIASQTKR